MAVEPPVPPVVPDLIASRDPANPHRPPSPGAALHAELICAGSPATIRLLGARTGDSPAYTWVRPGESLPEGRAPLVIGRGAEGRLWIDLARAPDVLTITGETPTGLRLAEELVEQLWAARIPLTVVGSEFADALPAGCRHVSALRHLTSPALSSDAIHVVMCVLPAGQWPQVQRLLRETGTRFLPVIIGYAPTARWSVRIADRSGAGTMAQQLRDGGDR